MKVSSLAFFLFAKCTFTVESRVGEALKEDSFKTMRMQEAQPRAERRLEKFTEPCTGLVVHVSMTPPGGQESMTASSIVQEYQYLACETPDGRAYKVQAADESFLQANFGTGIFISGETDIVFDDGLLGPVLLDLDSNEILSEGPPTLVKKAWEYGTRRNLINPNTTGDRTVLVVRVIAADGSTSLTEEELYDSVFGSENGDTVNLKSQFAACSHNKLNFIGIQNKEGKDTDITNSIVTITVIESTDIGGVAMQNKVTLELNKQFGVAHPSQLANHIMYCLPWDAMVFPAFTSDQSWNTVFKDWFCTSVSVQMHEIGHNLGMEHSGDKEVKYGDQSGLMGYSYGDSDTKMCFNGAKSWELGWYADKRHVEIDVSTTIRSYSGKLVPILDDPEESGDPMIIKVETGLDEDYYIAFNRASGFNADTREGGNTVMVTKKDKDDLSWLQGKLSAAQTWSISVDQNSGLDDILNVKVNSINLSDGNGYALVEVYLTSSNCIHRTGLCKKVPGCRWKNNQCMRDYCKDYGTDKTSCKADSGCKWNWRKRKCKTILN